MSLSIGLSRITKQIIIYLVTNGTIYKEEFFEKLKKFKSVQIEISVENMHVSNDYIRMGSDFKTTQENILKYNGHGIPIILRTVPQALSIGNYDTIIDFAIENKLVFDSNILYNPAHLKCFILPKSEKTLIADKIRSKYIHILSANNDRNDVAMIRSFID